MREARSLAVSACTRNISIEPLSFTYQEGSHADSVHFSKGDAADTFGETVGAGDNELEAGTKAIMAETGEQLPQVSQGGEVQMTLHQVNADGGGPYTCMINADGTGADWQDIDVTTTPPGENSRNRVSFSAEPLNIRNGEKRRSQK